MNSNFVIQFLAQPISGDFAPRDKKATIRDGTSQSTNAHQNPPCKSMLTFIWEKYDTRRHLFLTSFSITFYIYDVFWRYFYWRLYFDVVCHFLKFHIYDVVGCQFSDVNFNWRIFFWCRFLTFYIHDVV